MRTLAIIPARGGSKRIKNKNVKLFRGKPMLLHSLLAAKEAGCFDKIAVSTDSEEIASVAREQGFEVPYLREPSLSDDHSTLSDVLLHELKKMSAHYRVEFDAACMILATAPLLKPEFLRNGLDVLRQEGTPAVIPVTTFDFPIFRAFRLDEHESISMQWPENEFVRSNDLPEAFHDIGQFYWVRTGDFLEQKRIFMKGAKGLKIPRRYTQDIDTPEDWVIAEAYAEALANLAK
jgi:pseudaminic acid cytidylyltransferase